MSRPNPSHSDDWLDDEIDSLVWSVETDAEPDVVAAPSAADRAFARWFRRLAVGPVPRRRVDLGLYAFGVAASVIVGWLIVLLVNS